MLVKLRFIFASLESFNWYSSSETVGTNNGFHVIRDHWNGEPLHGNMPTLQKTRPQQKMRANHLGPDCLTRPDICDDGFSVNFRLKGNFVTFIVSEKCAQCKHIIV